MVRLTTQHIHTKLLDQKPVLRQIKLEVQNGPITKNGVLPVTLPFFENFISVLEPCLFEGVGNLYKSTFPCEYP